MVIGKTKDTKKKLDSVLTLRKTGKAKVESDISIKIVNSAKQNRVEEAIDMGQGDD